jgi:predicted DsbA family dithiol-disulfide isomerase
MREYMQMFAANFGVHDMGSPERIPNTRRSLAIAEYSRDQGKLESFRVLAMAAHWSGGKDLENDLDLAELATSAGLNAESALEASTSQEYLQRVDMLHEEASRLGITGIPTFIIGDQRIVGCQPYDALADAVRKAGIPTRDKSAN